MLDIDGADVLGCARSGGGSPKAPTAKYLGQDDLVRLCDSDTSHLKALLFTNPYCSGCRHELAERFLHPK